MNDPNRRDFLYWTTVAISNVGIEQLALPGALLLSACASTAPAFRGMDVSTGALITLRPTPLAVGHTFTGRYRSPQLGELTLSQNSNAVHGEYKTKPDEVWIVGRLEGIVQGNHCTFAFQENLTGGGVLRGHGFFLLDIPTALDPCPPQRLFGARSYQRSEPARAIGQRGCPPKAKSFPWTATSLEPRVECGVQT